MCVFFTLCHDFDVLSSNRIIVYVKLACVRVIEFIFRFARLLS